LLRALLADAIEQGDALDVPENVVALAVVVQLFVVAEIIDDCFDIGDPERRQPPSPSAFRVAYSFLFVTEPSEDPSLRAGSNTHVRCGH
jgi:hypothetical protein